MLSPLLLLQGGEVICEEQQCPQLNCRHPVKVEGQCCSTCLSKCHMERERKSERERERAREREKERALEPDGLVSN